jgi:hypothetical protein
LAQWVKAVWAIQAPPDDEDDTLHEFALRYYRFSASAEEGNPLLRIPAKPAVFIQFRKLEQLKIIQHQFPEAKLGPASAFTEGILFTKSWEEATRLQEKVRSTLLEEADDEMAETHAEDTLEDV